MLDRFHIDFNGIILLYTLYNKFFLILTFYGRFAIKKCLAFPCQVRLKIEGNSLNLLTQS